MSTDPKLENYLRAMDKALGPIGVSDRSDIITEIKSHVLDAQAKDPERGIGSILSSLGEPETVANRYLLERGLKPGKAPKAPIIKWLTIGFLGTLGILVLFVLLLIWKFTPLISVRDNGVKLLGGVINIEDNEGAKVAIDEGLLKMGKEVSGDTRRESWQVGGKTKVNFKGTQEIDTGVTHSFNLPFHNGKISVGPSADDKVHWLCTYYGEDKAATAKTGDEKFELNFLATDGTECDVKVPARLKTIIAGDNGELNANGLSADMDLKLSNGKVSFKPNPRAKYHYETTLTRGAVEGFKKSSDDAGAYKIKIDLTNGKIQEK